MVMIHGGFTANSSTANVFSRNIRGLAQNFHVFAVDRLASGMSGNPKSPSGYGYQGDVDFVYNFIKTMKLGRVHLVGHSAGGAIALYLALEHPEVVRTLTILAVGPENPPHGSNKLVGLLKQCPNQSTYNGLRCRAAMLAWLPTTFEEAYWKADEFMAELPKTQAARATLAAHREELAKEGTEIRDRMLERARTQGLNVPVLMVAGADDVLDWPADQPYADLAGQRALFHIISEKDTRIQMIVIANGGHFMYREHPTEFNTYLTTFIHYWEKNPAAPPQGMMPKPPKD
jgi:pimeloyl-ACP methyl ester carboxylesterase